MKCTTPAHVKNASTKQLLELWELTEQMALSPELPIVRGWLMDELDTGYAGGLERKKMLLELENRNASQA